VDRGRRAFWPGVRRTLQSRPRLLKIKIEKLQGDKKVSGFCGVLKGVLFLIELIELHQLFVVISLAGREVGERKRE